MHHLALDERHGSCMVACGNCCALGQPPPTYDTLSLVSHNSQRIVKDRRRKPNWCESTRSHEAWHRWGQGEGEGEGIQRLIMRPKRTVRTSGVSPTDEDNDSGGLHTGVWKSIEFSRTVS